MASETFNEQSLPCHRIGDLVTKKLSGHKKLLGHKSHLIGQVVHLFLIDFEIELDSS